MSFWFATYSSLKFLQGKELWQNVRFKSVCLWWLKFHTSVLLFFPNRNTLVFIWLQLDYSSSSLNNLKGKCRLYKMCAEDEKCLCVEGTCSISKMSLHSAGERGGCGQRVPSPVSRRDRTGTRDKNAVAPVNWCVSNYVIFQQEHVPTESPNPILEQFWNVTCPKLNKWCFP